MRQRVKALRSLLNYLAVETPTGRRTWEGWAIRPLSGGRNNVLYRVTRAGRDLVVKFTIPDKRDRAGREYGALRALQECRPGLAPRPVLLERKRYRQPVVVQTFVQGRMPDAPPIGAGEAR